MLAGDYRLFTDALGAEMFGWGREEGPRYGEYFRRCVEPGTALRIYDAMVRVNLSEILPRVATPTLVVRNAESGMISVDGTREFVSLMPDASLAVISGAPNERASLDLVSRVGAFLGEQWDVEQAASAPAPRAESGLQIVLFVDIEEHTSMMQRLGDAAGREVLRDYERLTRESLRQFGGAEVKAMGDGFMASFRSAQSALDCAQDLQSRFAQPVSPRRETLRVRVGLNAGEPIAEDGDLFGTAVITAARIAALARGSEILCANVVRELVAGKSYLFSDYGHHALRGMDEPVRLWSLRWTGATA
jgi:class 3 adenylate cyclase